MEYAGAVGVEVANMLASINEKVWVIRPHVLAQHIFGGNGLQNFIRDYQDCLEWLEDQLGDLTTMTNMAVERLMIHSESYCWDLCWVEALNSELLRQVTALKHGQGNPIIIPDSLELIPVPPPGGLGPGSVLAEIDDGVDDEWAQAIMED